MTETLPGENENDYLIDGLKSKVDTLKSLTLDMGDEIKGQNSFLKDMDTDFDSTWGKLSGNMRRVERLAKNVVAKHMVWVLLLFALVVFFIIWVIIRFR